jgi:hypothetical protein
VLRVETVEGISTSDQMAEPGHQSPGQPGWVTVHKGTITSRRQVSDIRRRVESLLVVLHLLDVTTPPGELAEKELLRDVCGNPLSRANRKISEHQSGTTIDLRIVKVRER